MEQIVEGVWLGDSLDAKFENGLREANIRSVLNCAWDLSYEITPSILQVKVGLIDGPGNRTRAMGLAINALEKLTKLGPVLVHCHAGKSRSPSVIAAWLVRFRGWRSLEEAYAEIYRERPSMDPRYDPKVALKQLAQDYLNGVED